MTGDPANAPQSPTPQSNPRPANPQPQPGKPQPGNPQPQPGKPQPGHPQPANPQPANQQGQGRPGGPQGTTPQQPGMPTPPTPPTTPPPDPDRVKQVESAEQLWANPATEAQEQHAREREDKLSGDFTFHGGAHNVITAENVIYQTVRGEGRATVNAYRLPPDVIGQPYEPTAALARLQAAVRTQKLLVVRGRPGTGKTAALLRAFTGGDGDTVVMKLADGTDLSTLAPERLPACQAIVLDDLTQDQLDQLSNYVVGRLQSALDGKGRWLGLTVADDLAIPPALDGLVVDIGDPPAARDVFLRHLRARLDPQTCDDIMGQVAWQLDDDGASLALERVAGLARELAQKPGSPDDVNDVARRWLDFRYECVQWFCALPDARAHSTALALAVFDGLPREEVTAAADRLLELIKARPQPRSTDPFGAQAGVPLRLLRARSEADKISAVEGDMPANVLRYVNPGYPGWVLEYAWNELDAVRPHLVTWLRELGGHHNPDVRTAAAVAVGVLSKNAFDFLYAQIIGEWAGAKNVELRESATLALGPPSRDEKLRGTVDGVVQAWIADADQPLRQATAARTFGGESGRARFFRSIRQLARLAEVDHIDVALAVAMSFGDYLLLGTPAMAGRVLTDIVGWMRGRSRQLRLVGHLAFQRLTYLRGEPALLGGPDDAQRDTSLRSVPTMLILASQDPRIGECVVWLWVDGLTSSDAHRRMRTALRRWAEAVDGHAAARAVLAEVLRRIVAASPRAAAVIRLEPSLTDLI